MVKSKPLAGSELEVWPEKYISAYDRGEYAVLPDRYKNAEIVQIEHAYEDKYLVEVIRPSKMVVKLDYFGEDVRKGCC